MQGTSHTIALYSVILGGWTQVAGRCIDAPKDNTRMENLYQIQSPDWYSRDHHDGDGGFHNVWGRDREVPFLRAMPWLLGRAVTRRKQHPPPVYAFRPESLETHSGAIRLTWLGHSTTYVQTNDTQILIDPIFTRRASPVSFAGPQRQVPIPVALSDLPGVDVVLISHDHYDHLDKGSIKALEREFSPLFIVPLDLGQILRRWGASRILELDWWQYVDVEDVRYTCTPAQHFSGRGLFNRNGTLWASWHMAFASARTSIYYAGDTGYASHFVEIRQRLGAPSVALIPIGAYLPRWFMQPVHVDPAEAIQAFEDLEAKQMIGVHWGTFDLTDEPLDEPPREIRERARRSGLTERIHVLDVGAAFVYTPGNEIGGLEPTGGIHTTPTDAFKSRL